MSEVTLLQFRLDSTADLGELRVEAGPALIFPLDVTIVEIQDGTEAFRLDRSDFLLLEAGHRHRVKPISPTAQVLTLLPNEAAIEHTVEQYEEHIDRGLFQADLARTRVFSRTRWVDELANRYLFERRICHKHLSEAARFLETELLKELYFFCREAERPRASVVHEGLPLVNAARAWIEQHLFEPESIGQLAERFNTSASSLLRAFKRELGVSPVEYLRARRLDEALLLVQSGKYTVTEVAFRASYQNLSAFSVAFRKRFGISPSGLRSPHGRALGQSPSAIGPRSA